MKANLKKLRKRRVFANEFKQSLVKEFDTGQFSVNELNRLHGIANSAIYLFVLWSRASSMVSATPLRELKINFLEDYLPVSHTNPLIKSFLL